MIAVEVLAGPLTPSEARRAVRLARAHIVACTLALPMRIELLIAGSHVQIARATPPAPCAEAALTALQFPSSTGLSRVRVTLRLAHY